MHKEKIMHQFGNSNVLYKKSIKFNIKEIKYQLTGIGNTFSVCISVKIENNLFIKNKIDKYNT